MDLLSPSIEPPWQLILVFRVNCVTPPVELWKWCHLPGGASDPVTSVSLPLGTLTVWALLALLWWQMLTCWLADQKLGRGSFLYLQHIASSLIFINFWQSGFLFFERWDHTQWGPSSTPSSVLRGYSVVLGGSCSAEIKPRTDVWTLTWGAIPVIQRQVSLSAQ